ncbi:MAG TPA: WYL domain-containing protein, partial [Bacillota bacterium]|nr:WYL domain-containing protein [Bacillota bacterium]
FYTIDRLFNAIRNGKKLSFTLQTVVPADMPRGYETVSRRRGKVYTVSPAGLCWDDENYYLVAYEDDAKKLKHYRVDRMTDVKVLEDKIIMPAEYCNIDMVLYQRMMFDMFGGDEETVVIEFDRELISVVVDRFGDVVIRKTPGGRYSTAVKVFVSPPFMSWVFMFGKQMKIVSPPEAVQRYCRRLREAEEGYDFSSEQC